MNQTCIEISKGELIGGHLCLFMYLLPTELKSRLRQVLTIVVCCIYICL